MTVAIADSGSEWRENETRTARSSQFSRPRASEFRDAKEGGLVERKASVRRCARGGKVSEGRIGLQVQGRNGFGIESCTHEAVQMGTEITAAV